MAKRARRARRRVAKKSWLDKLFTFPKLALYLFVALSVFTVYQVAQPSKSVEGASTIESTFKYKLKMTVYKDSNWDANRQSSESCLAKTFTVKITDKDGKTTSATATGSQDCNTYAIPVPVAKGYCNTVKFVSNLANWTITGIKYSDSNHYGKVLLGKSSVKVCVYPPAEGLNVEPVAYINFGLKPR